MLCNCSQGKCARCFFQRNEKKLLEEFHWLEQASAGFGCSLCRQFYAGKPMLSAAHGGSWRQNGVQKHASLQPRNLRKHADSQEHQRAADGMAGVAFANASSAPSHEDFRQLIMVLQKHTVGRDGVDKVAGHKKARRMAWCIAEASRDMKRDMWRPGVGADGKPVIFSTTLYQDARAGRLSIRFSAASSAMDTCSGHLYTVNLKDFSTDSVGLMKATMFALRAFCCRRLHPPYLEGNKQVTLPDENLEMRARLLSSVETFCSDAASDEIRAGRMLAGQTSVTDEYLPRLPNLKMVVRDRPHAVRRVLTRGWQPDGYLQEVATEFVAGKGSPVNRIQHSHVFQDFFSANIKALDPGLRAVRTHPHMQDLSYAPHRFESATKPLARIVLFLHAFLATVSQIAWDRKHEEEGKDMARFLLWLDDERLLTLALMADAATETTDLLRMVDYQGHPVDELGANVLGLKHRVRKLFLGAAPLCLRTGFTAHMIKLLGSERVFTVPSARGTTKNVRVGHSGGMSEVVIQRCLSRLAAWILVAESTLDAEFPSFEAMECFSIFTVTGESRDAVHTVSNTSKMSRLQRAFGLPDDYAAVDQLVRFRRMAERAAKEEGLQSAAAWREGLRRATRTWTKPELSALLQVMVRFWATGASTSGVEQSFGKTKTLCEGLQEISHVNDIMEDFGL